MIVSKRVDLAKESPPARVVIAHDYLTQRGGAERVVLAMLQAFPDARVVTSLYAPDLTYPEFKQYDIRASWLTRIKPFERNNRLALPLLAPVWSRLDAGDADVVLCSSTGWAHGIRTTVPKIVYCHNPARWLYQSDEYMTEAGAGARFGLRLLAPELRRWDKRKARQRQCFCRHWSIGGRLSGSSGSWGWYGA